MEPRLSKTVVAYLRKEGYTVSKQLAEYISDILEVAICNRRSLIEQGVSRETLRFSCHDIKDYLIKKGKLCQSQSKQSKQ